MFVFMGNVVQAEDIPEKLRKLAASVDTIAFCQNWVKAFWIQLAAQVDS
jgi:hypothetical protein